MKNQLCMFLFTIVTTTFLPSAILAQPAVPDKEDDYMVRHGYTANLAPNQVLRGPMVLYDTKTASS